MSRRFGILSRKRNFHRIPPGWLTNREMTEKSFNHFAQCLRSRHNNENMKEEQRRILWMNSALMYSGFYPWMNYGTLTERSLTQTSGCTVLLVTVILSRIAI